jgi:hypothetical protein
MADPGQVIPKVLSASAAGLPILVVGTTPATADVVHVHDGTANTLDVPSVVLCNTDASADIEGGVVIFTGSTPSDPGSIVFREVLQSKSGAHVAIAENIKLGIGCKVGVWGGTTLKITVAGHVGKEYVST